MSLLEVQWHFWFYILQKERRGVRFIRTGRHSPVFTCCVSLRHPQSVLLIGVRGTAVNCLAKGWGHYVFNSDYAEVYLRPLGEVIKSPTHGVLIRVSVAFLEKSMLFVVVFFSFCFCFSSPYRSQHKQNRGNHLARSCAQGGVGYLHPSPLLAALEEVRLASSQCQWKDSIIANRLVVRL